MSKLQIFLNAIQIEYHLEPVPHKTFSTILSATSDLMVTVLTLHGSAMTERPTKQFAFAVVCKAVYFLEDYFN